jgi:hypothetical protein
MPELSHITPHEPAVEMVQYMLTPIKSIVTDFSKSFPDVVMAKEIDFEMWGRKFVVTVVNRLSAPM